MAAEQSTQAAKQVDNPKHDPEQGVVRGQLANVRVPTMFSLVPKNLAEAMQLADLIANSDLAPKDYKGKPGNVLIAVQMGQEVGLSPMAAIQSIAVINGKPSLYGDVGKAILLSNGFTIEEFDTGKIKAGGFAMCKITRPGHPPCERTFSVNDAKVAGLWGKEGPWTKYPERQMAWRAFWFAARDIAADVLKGLAGAEEVIDLTEKDITPTADTEYKTGTQRLRAAVVQPPSLDDVLKAIADATTQEAMLAAAELAKKLTSEDDREKAGEAYRKRIADARQVEHSGVVIEQDTGAITFSYANVADKLNKAANMDDLDAAADLIQHITGGADQIEELNKIYKVRRSDFKKAG